MIVMNKWKCLKESYHILLFLIYHPLSSELQCGTDRNESKVIDQDARGYRDALSCWCGFSVRDFCLYLCKIELKRLECLCHYVPH